jgi:hypothetical protein
VIDLESHLDGSTVDTIERTWQHIAAPGSFYKGGERVEVAAIARARLRSGERPATSLTPTVVDTIEKFAVDAHTITGGWVAERERSGISGPAYVELLSVTSFTVVLDTFAFGVGVDPHPLPTPVPGDSTGEVDERAEVQGGWIPTVGRAFPPTGFSAIPAEHRMMHTLHDVLYIGVPKMVDLGLVRDGLARDQMEIIAARTSLLNDCFF